MIHLSGRIDSENASMIEEEIVRALEEQEGDKIIFDASELDYISSAGLRILMRISKQTGKPIQVTGVSLEIYDIFEMTGFTEIMEVKKKIREVSVEGCPVIGKGFFGTVYRLDNDTIVKLYNSPDSDSIRMIENERKMARTAFIKGIPTAISYDTVRCGNHYGSVFELLEAKTMNEILVADLSRADELVREYAEFVKLVHNTAMDAGALPSAVDAYAGYLETVRKYISDECYDRIKALFEKMPEDHHVVHGDFHMKHIMLTKEGPMLIDMDTLNEGNPVFDLGSIYCVYREFNRDNPEDSMEFFGIDDDMACFVWEKLTEYYFATSDKAVLSTALDKIRIISAIRFLFLLATTDQGSEDEVKIMIRHTTADLEELVLRVHELTL